MPYNRYVNKNGVRQRITVSDPAPAAAAAPARQAASMPAMPRKKPTLDLGGIGGMLKGLLPTGLDTGDILLFAVLFLLYVESGDIETLIIMGVLLFMN